jgi:hypothetical protein
MRLAFRWSRLLILASLCVPSTGSAQDTPTAPRSEVRAGGSAQRTLRPNLAILTLEFSDVGATPSAAGANVAGRATRLRRALQGLGIARDSLASANGWNRWRGRVEPVYGPNRCWQPSPQQPQTCAQDTTYRIHEAVQVRVHDITKVGAVIDTALAHRVVQISAVRYVATKTDSLQEQLLREATEQAHRRARAMADASTMRLGRLVSVTAQDGPGSRAELSVVQATGAGAPTEALEPGIPVTISVSGVWELQP